MAFSRTRADRPESLVFRNPTSPRDQTAFPLGATPLSPLRNLASRVAPSLQTPADVRGSLQRRFTTNALPPLAPIGEQRARNGEQRENTQSAYNRVSAAEKKAREYEALLAQQRRIQAQMEMIDPETRREVDEVQRLEQDISRFTSGVFSEPTTPPDYHATTPTSAAPFSNRFSTSSLASQSFSTRPSRSGSQLTSPPTEYARPFTSHATPQMPSKSVPNSQRNSDGEGSDDDYAFGFTDVHQKAGANPNRNSMPVTAYDLRNQSNTSNYSSLLGSVNTTSFLFGDEDEQQPVRPATATKVKISPDTQTYLQLHQTEDKFPILVRRETDSNLQFSKPSAALDLASETPVSAAENQALTSRAVATRHRQSLPPSAMRQPILSGDGITGLNGILADATTAKNTAANRRSLEVKFSGLSGLSDAKRPSLLSAQQRGLSNGFPKVSSSYSTNDIPTLKSISAAASQEYLNIDNNIAVQSPVNEVLSPIIMAPGNNPQNGIHRNALFQKSAPPQHIPRQSQASQMPIGEAANIGLPRSPQSGLQASAAPFGPSMNVSTNDGNSVPGAHAVTAANTSAVMPYGAPAYYGGYGMQLLDNAFNNMSIGSYQSQWSAPQPLNQPRGGYYNNPAALIHTPASRYGDGQVRGSHLQRRVASHSEDSSRYAQVPVSAVRGEIHIICKDQNGCRYLQKQLEGRNPDDLQMIFEEVNPHVVELMTDSFGNYLCQKLFERATDSQRSALVASAAPSMVKIALNQHGTRALQKLIETVTTAEQTTNIIEALRFDVVQLIQDLNGNHVIQKCLNHMYQADIQFVVDAVANHVVAVGTHRHGCCVLQRCIDHASGLQKAQLVAAVTKNSFALVQDPFGNYVTQYILDLNEPAFSEPIVSTFVGSIPVLARQKFSSNVIEKGIRTAKPDLQRKIILEMLESPELERMVRDSFANYVVQTGLDYAEPEIKARFMDRIRPMLPAIRHAPHGRRIAAKLQDYDNDMGAPNSGLVTPSDILSPGQITLSSPYSTIGTHSSATSSYGGTTLAGSVTSPYGFTPQRGANGHSQGYGDNQGYPPMGRRY